MIKTDEAAGSSRGNQCTYPSLLEQLYKWEDDQQDQRVRIA